MSTLVTCLKVLAAVDLDDTEPAVLRLIRREPHYPDRHPGNASSFRLRSGVTSKYSSSELCMQEDVLFKRCFIAARIMGEDAPDNVDDNIAEVEILRSQLAYVWFY